LPLSDQEEDCGPAKNFRFAQVFQQNLMVFGYHVAFFDAALSGRNWQQSG